MGAKFFVSRYNSEVDAKAHLQEFTVVVPKGATLLDCLNIIKWEQDGTFSFRMSCRSAICGSCAVRVNGHARLACKTQAADVIVDGEVTIEPLGNLPVIRDLIVDLEPFWESLERVKPWLVPDETKKFDRERLQSHHDQLKIDAASTCIMCGSCYSDCNVLNVDKMFLGPASLAKAQRFVFDTRDSEKEARLDFLSQVNGMWDCTHCAECSTRCPTEAKPLERIIELRQEAVNSGFTNNNGARHVLGFRESIGGFKGKGGGGMLNENYLPLRSVGLSLGGMLSLLPVGIRMIMRGKNPPMIPHIIDKIGEVRKMFRRFDEYRKEGEK
ncbi:MAG: succinate dehydrogenase/fumarate reductase iron-sulfur subunit [Nitrospinae bacterium]|nr:succinate dehydrogenase/fumarate reductase iron-sulfur subunit [Nitrospinota bacterium]